MNPKVPYARISYNGRDITADMTPYIIKVRVVDKTITDAKKNESDELSIELEDSAQLWISDWMPAKGDTLTVEIGYETDSLSFGTFEIDEISYSGPPNVVSINALAAGISRQTKSKRSSAHENKTLRQVVENIAQLNGLTVEGEIADIQIGRVTQDRETDQAFLARISDDYGYVFSIRDDKIIFTRVYDVQEQDAVSEIDVTQMTRWDIKDSSANTASSAAVSYHDITKNEDFKFTFGADDQGFDFGTKDSITLQEAFRQTNVKEDVLERTVLAAVYKDVVKKTGLRPDQIQVRKRVENQQQAKEVARAALHKANSRQITGSVRVVGNPRYMAGANVELTGLRKLSGKYNIEQATHEIARSGGYTCDLDVKKVGRLTDSAKEAPLTERLNPTIQVQDL